MKKVKRMGLLLMSIFLILANRYTTVLAASELDSQDIEGLSVSGTAKVAPWYTAQFIYDSGFSRYRVKGDDGIIRDAFCVEPHNYVHNGNREMSQAGNWMSKENWDLLSRYVFYAYDCSDKTDQDVVFTQLLIWDLIGNRIHTKTHVSLTDGDTGEQPYQSIEWTGSYKGTDIGIHSKAYQDFKQRISKLAECDPDLEKTSVTLKPGLTERIADRNGIVHTMNIRENTANVDVSVQGDTIQLTGRDNSSKGKIVLARTSADYDDSDRACMFYDSASGRQDKATYKLTDQSAVEILVDFEPYSVLQLTKSDAYGAPVAGARLTLTRDKDQTVLDEWISDGTSKIWRFSDLEDNETLTITETKTPEGYVTAQPAHVQVKKGQTVAFDMKDGRVVVHKKDNQDNPVIGAGLQVISSTGTVVDQWTSQDGGHAVRGLVEGQTYELQEYSTPVGYYEAGKITIQASDQQQNIEMTDAVIECLVAKVDEQGEPVEGASLKISDQETGELIGTWESQQQPWSVGHLLTTGHTYVLEETSAPAGYHPASSVVFSIPLLDPQKPITISLVDDKVGVQALKTDDQGKPLAGAKMRLISRKDDREDILAEWISGDQPYDLSDYVIGAQQYWLQESEAPYGWQKAAEVSFTVTGTRQTIQTVVMKDEPQTIRIGAVKKDSSTGALLGDCELTLKDENGFIIQDLNGKDCVALTNGRNPVLWQIPYRGKATYYVYETKAPEGYRLNHTPEPVKIDETYTFRPDDIVTITILDDAIPVTGAESRGWMSLAGACAAGVIIGLVLIFRRKKAS